MAHVPAVRLLHAYSHHGRIAVVVEVGCQSETLVGMDEFRLLVNDVALHVAAENPANVSALLNQPFVKDRTVTVRGMLERAAHRYRERLVVTRFVRWCVDDEIGRPSSPDPKGPASVVRIGGRA